MDPAPAPARWRRLTIGRMMVAVALLAVGLKLYSSIGSGWGNAFASLVLALFAARTILANPAGSPARRRAVSWTRACLAAYLPCGVGLPIVRDCGHCVGTWMQLWPLFPGALPGLLVSQFVVRQGRWEAVEWLLAASFTLALIALMAALGMRGRWWTIASLTAGASYCAFASWAISSVMRS